MPSNSVIFRSQPNRPDEICQILLALRDTVFVNALVLYQTYSFLMFVPMFQGRAWSRAKSRRNLDYTVVLNALEEKGISIRVASPKLVMEEAPESYKNVTDVVDTCKCKSHKNIADIVNICWYR